MASNAIVHSNRYHAGAVCEFCDGIIRHEPWCIEKCAEVRYAYEIILKPELITESDLCALHGMGVTYCSIKCRGKK